MYLYQNGHQRSYRYAEDYLCTNNSTGILHMLSKYHESLVFFIQKIVFCMPEFAVKVAEREPG